MLTIQQQDEKGNKLYNKWENILLYISPLNVVRRLCKIKDKTVFVSRKNRHIFRKLNAYWFNYTLLSLLPNEYIVELKQEDKSVLKTTVWNILHKWQFLNFGMQGFEKQVFLPIKDFTL